MYLRARNYDASIGRFTQQDDWEYGSIRLPLSSNLYTYCGNNPVYYIDPSGHYLERDDPTEPHGGGEPTNLYIGSFFNTPIIGGPLSPAVAGNPIGVISTGGYAGNPGISTTPGTANPSPGIKEGLESIIVSAITAVFLAILNNIKQSVKTETDTKTKEKEKNQAYFPENPDDFHPKGLVRNDHDGTKNGKIITWQDPISNKAIFEWDEDYTKGSHYYAIMPEWDGEHRGKHLHAGDAVPEPWNSIYFGG